MIAEVGAAARPRRGRARFDDGLVEEVRRALVGERFLDLARVLGGKPRKAGADWRCACFIHGGSGPNLVLSPTRGLWNCLSTCGGGDGIALVMRARSVDFRDALEWLAEWIGLEGRSTIARLPSPSRADASESVRHTVPAPTIASASGGACAAFLAALWSLVAECGWSGRVSEWLADRRGVEPDAAFVLGCRDWSSARRELAELFDATSIEVLEAVGFVREGRPHRVVLGVLRGDPAWDAVAVPIWRLGQAYPERWRFRLVTPWPTSSGGSVKSFGPFATSVPLDLLGVGVPPRVEAPEVVLARLGDGTPGSRVLVLVEGEPDWWSAVEALDGRAVVLGVCGSPARWRESWLGLGDLAALGVERVAVCVHKGDPTKARDGVSHGERFARDVEGACARTGIGFARKLAAEGADLNDLHRARTLRAWLADLLEVRHGK